MRLPLTPQPFVTVNGQTMLPVIDADGVWILLKCVSLTPSKEVAWNEDLAKLVLWANEYHELTKNKAPEKIKEMKR